MLRAYVCFSFLFIASGIGFCGEYGGGDGTAENPYQIASIEHLIEFGETQADYKSHFVLISDLDMAGTVYKQAIIAPDLDSDLWGPQGGGRFVGSFDGGGHTISNFSAESSADYIAIFGHVGEGSVIRDLHVENANVKGGFMVSCLVASFEGTMENCSVTGNLECTYVAGGLVGFLDKGSAVNSTSDVTIKTDNQISRRIGRISAIGGLVGSNHLSRIDNCFSKCKIVTAQDLNECGGIAGRNSGTIINSYCENVSIVSETKAESIGALCGYNGGTIRNSSAFDFEILCNGFFIGGLVGNNDSLIAMSIAEGQVAAKSDGGGIAGKNSGYIIDCYSNVITAAEGKAGGFVGKNSYGVLRSYSVGKAISLNNMAGGFVGDNSGIIDLSFWDAQKIGNDFDVAAIAKQTSDLKKISTFKCWGDGVWVVDEDSDYPRLVWENTPGVVLEDGEPEYGGGSGTVEDPYLIYNSEQLTSIGVYPQDLEKNYKLMSDIDMQDVEFFGIGYGFGFGGVFDGNGYVIRNYSIDNDLPYAGLFNVVLKTGTIRNIVVEGFEISGTNSVGGLCGKNEGLIEKCKVTGNVYAVKRMDRQEKLGGAVGDNLGVIKESFSEVIVDVSYDNVFDVGCFVGCNSGIIRNCGSIGEVICSGINNRRIGGFMGRGGWDSKVYNCYFQGALTVSGKECKSIGGFAGGQDYRTLIDTSYCSTAMSLAADCKEYAAFIGYVHGTSSAHDSRVMNCFWNSDLETPNEGLSKGNSNDTKVSPATTEQLKDAVFLESAGWEVSSVPGEKTWLLESGELPQSNK